MAYVKASADYTDQELLWQAVRWHCRDADVSWQYREAWAIRCVERVREETGCED